jgi:hypothetical protein
MWATIRVSARESEPLAMATLWARRREAHCQRSMGTTPAAAHRQRTIWPRNEPPHSAAIVAAALTASAQAQEGTRTVIVPATNGVSAGGGPARRKTHHNKTFLKSGSSDLCPM